MSIGYVLCRGPQEVCYELSGFTCAGSAVYPRFALLLMMLIHLPPGQACYLECQLEKLIAYHFDIVYIYIDMDIKNYTEMPHTIQDLPNLINIRTFIYIRTWHVSFSILIGQNSVAEWLIVASVNHMNSDLEWPVNLCLQVGLWQQSVIYTKCV